MAAVPRLKAPPAVREQRQRRRLLAGRPLRAAVSFGVDAPLDLKGAGRPRAAFRAGLATGRYAIARECPAPRRFRPCFGRVAVGSRG